MRKFGVLCLVCILAITFASFSLAEEKKLKAAFVYISAVGDHGWSYAHDLGRKYIEETLGVETAYTENVFGPDIERVIRGYAQKGYDIILR